MIKFNIATINTCTTNEGPYKRLAVWFQGCNIGCQGCCNADYQPLEYRHILTLEQLLDIIEEAKVKYQIEGVTYTGGEPTLQQGLTLLTEEIHKLGLGVISFTGRLYEDVSQILYNCDVVLDGHFDKKNKDSNRRLLGSTNQRILCLSDRYKDIIDKWFFDAKVKSIDVNVGENIVFNGDYFSNSKE